MIGIGIVVVVLFACFAIFSAFLARYAVRGSRFTLDEAWDWQMKNVPGTEIFRREDFSDYTITSYDGYTLHASMLPAREPSDRYVILAHGYSDARFGMLKYMPIFVRMNFNCILYDERGHGENKRQACSFGIREARDLIAVIDDVHRRYGEDIRLGLYGESLGGATVMTALGYHPKVDFAIDDCGFADIINVLKKALKDHTPIPTFMVYPASAAARVLYGCSFTAAQPEKALRENEVPFLVMHGGADDFVPCENGRRAADANKGQSELHVFDGAGHAQSIMKNRTEYEAYVERFVKKACV